MKFLKLTIFLFSIILLLGACSKDDDCEKGFTGENCDEPLTPTEMHVSKVTLTKFPPGKGVFGNLDWDLCDYPCSNPDIFVAFRQGLDMGESRTESEKVHENCENGTDYVYSVDWIFEDAGATYSFGTYEYKNGAEKCFSDDPEEVIGTWELTEDGTQIHIVAGGDDQNVDILELTETRLVWETSSFFGTLRQEFEAGE